MTPSTAGRTTLNTRVAEDGSADYEFYVDGTADWQWTSSELAAVLIGQVGTAPVAIHTGTLALALQPSGRLIEQLLAQARDQVTVSIDPNLRTTIVPVKEYRRRIDDWACLSDIIGLSHDDLAQLWPQTSPERAAQILHTQDVSLVIVSLGAAGVFASLRGNTVHVPAVATTIVDTVGAEDSFHGGLLHDLGQAGHLGGRLETLTMSDLRAALQFASHVAAITVSRAGANPPWADDCRN